MPTNCLLSDSFRLSDGPGSCAVLLRVEAACYVSFSVAVTKGGKPIGRCHLEPDTPYLIEKMERYGLCGLYIFVHLVCPPLGNLRYCLPEYYAMVVTDEDIRTVNSGPLLHVFVLRSRRDMPDVFDLVVV